MRVDATHTDTLPCRGERPPAPTAFAGSRGAHVIEPAHEAGRGKPRPYTARNARRRAGATVPHPDPNRANGVR